MRWSAMALYADAAGQPFELGEILGVGGGGATKKTK